MTGSGINKQKKKKNRNKNKNKYDDTTGPKIRHPSGEVYPSTIFLNEKTGKTKLSKVARLYQNIIEYSISTEYTDKPLQKQQNERKGFKITDIGNWLLDHNSDYKNYYTDSTSKIPKGRRLSGISKRIKRYLNNLERWGLISKICKVDVKTKNGQRTWLCGYTNYGYIIAWMLEYSNNNDDDKKQIAKNEIFELIQDQFKAVNSYTMDFLARLYEKFKECGLFDELIKLVILSLKNQKYPQVAEYVSFAQSIILTKYSQSLKLYFETLNDFSEDIRKLIIHQEKCIFESNMLLSQPPKEWQKIWSENVNNYNKIILYGKCQNKGCSKYGPVVCSFYDYRKAIAMSPSIDYSSMKCSYCNTENALHIYDSMNKFYTYNKLN